MTKEENKDIALIKYNRLNLPTEIQFTNNRKINYIYDATGVKQKKVVFNGTHTTTTSYIDGYQYENKSTAIGGRGYEHLLFFPHAEGYVKPVYAVFTSNKVPKFQYVYNHTDHLGNIRISYSKVDRVTKVLEENNYYAFGLKHSNYNASINNLTRKASDDQKTAIPATETSYNYKYNGKELQDELGLDWYDYGARNYDASLGRWMNIDPLAEKYYNNTPYNYVNNNPLNFIDPDGRSGIATIKKDEDGNEYVEISSKIYFYGEQSSSDFAKTTASHIQKMWNDGGGTVEIDGKSYSVKFSVTGEHVTEEKATELAESNGTNAENNFVRVTDGSDLSSSGGIKSSFFEFGKNSGVFLNYEMGGKKTTDAHEMGHGYGWYEAGDHSGGTHDVYPLDAYGKNPTPGIMSARGTPVYDKYGYKGQASGNKTIDPTKRAVLPSDISKLSINVSTLKANGSVNVGTAGNNIYNENGTTKN